MLTGKTAVMNTLQGICFVFCCALFSLGSALKCYKCSDYSGSCSNIQECTFEDSCMAVKEQGGKTIKQCIRYTDCTIPRLTQMFPSITGVTFRCCNSDLCNSSPAIAMNKPFLVLLVLMMISWLHLF